jgi:hypothetical protein
MDLIGNGESIKKKYRQIFDCCLVTPFHINAKAQRRKEKALNLSGLALKISDRFALYPTRLFRFFI